MQTQNEYIQQVYTDTDMYVGCIVKKGLKHFITLPNGQQFECDKADDAYKFFS